MIASDLLEHALAPSTQTTYKRALQYYNNFKDNFDFSKGQYPASVEEITLFIAYFYTQALASSTVLTYISALSYQHKINNIDDPTQSFVVKKC